MKIYLVGGAVRDELLGLPIKEKDYVVMGSTADQMLQAGFQPVGKSFPVFLHPDTKDEYALARTEKKVEKGYHGFTFHADPSVTLEEDLRRRDITINAIAKNIDDGTLYDPYHGQEDLEEKWLRHVSEAFIEDPVRILRVARFAARFTYLGFKIHPDTMTIMKAMVANGEVDALISERVWRETQIALTERNPEIFFQVLKNCGALHTLFPDLEHDFNQAMNALCAVCALTEDPLIRFASMACDRMDHLRLPSDYQQVASLVAKYREDCKPSSAEETLTLLEQVDAFRRPDRFKAFLMACLLDKSDEKRIVGFFQAAHGIDTASIAANNPDRIKEAIRGARLEAIQTVLRNL